MSCPVAHPETPVGGSYTSMSDGPRVPLYSDEFAQDPHGVYRAARERFGSLVPAWLAEGVPATLVIGYHTAVQILHDAQGFPADPSRWQRGADPQSSVFEVLRERNNSLRTSGRAHARLRATITAALAEVDHRVVERTVDKVAVSLINGFCREGRADLRAQYAFPLTVRVMCDLLGLAPTQAHQVWSEMAAMLDGVADEETQARFGGALYAVAQEKRARPGADMMSRLLTHPAALTDIEVVEQTALLLGPGTEPTSNLILNATLLAVSDERFSGGVHGGSLELRDAIDEVLFVDTPLANFCVTYPRVPTPIGGVWLPADEPVVISMAACNADPAVSPEHAPLGLEGIDRWGNRSHLSWGAGPHRCPAIELAQLIVGRAMGQLLDALPDLALPKGFRPVYRPGPFNRALAELPVVFPPSRPMNLPTDPYEEPR